VLGRGNRDALPSPALISARSCCHPPFGHRMGVQLGRGATVVDMVPAVAEVEVAAVAGVAAVAAVVTAPGLDCSERIPHWWPEVRGRGPAVFPSMRLKLRGSG